MAARRSKLPKRQGNAGGELAQGANVTASRGPQENEPGQSPVEHRSNSAHAGRPKGSRNKLGEHFIAALCADFEAHGSDAIGRVRDEDPAVYVRIVAQIAPQAVLVENARLDELTDDELAAYLFAVREALGAREAAFGGADAQARGEPAQPLPPLSEAEAVS
jgi:hypothetical protein